MDPEAKARLKIDEKLTAASSDLARDSFKDPYRFGFIASEGLRSELEFERKLTERITDFLPQ